MKKRYFFLYLCGVQKHTKLYLKHFGYDVSSFVPCEVCGCRAVDIHHIEPRGMGGSKKADTIDNLMALCRECHIEYGDKKQHKFRLHICHQLKLSEAR